MTVQRLLLTAWDWEPSVVLGCIALVLAYLAALRFRPSMAWVPFLLGVGILLLSLVSPIDVLGDRYLFSVHMLQHLLMIVVIPPLLLLGLPADLVRRIVAWRPARIVATASSNGPAAWLLAVTTLYVWHVPVLYDAALHSEPLHILEHLCFLVTATIFWWPVLAPLPEYRLPVASAIIYLFAASIANDALGIAITFAAPGLYPTYLRPDNAQGILTLLRDNLGISASQDQQAAGILMWIPSNLPFLVAIIGLLIRWFGEPEPDIAQVNGPAGAR